MMFLAGELMIPQWKAKEQGRSHWEKSPSSVPGKGKHPKSILVESFPLLTEHRSSDFEFEDFIGSFVDPADANIGQVTGWPV
jgi:hypothetical protein